MSANANRLGVDRDGLFTEVEHAVLARWFRQRKPAGAVRIDLDDALAELGFEERCEPYSRTAAAVAHIVLEAIEERLPVWACWKGDKLIKARSYREPHQKPQRRTALLPSELFAINWASSGPGFDWPVQYHLVWTPIRRDRIGGLPRVLFGYADFALGHFGREDNIGQSVIRIIRRDWTMQRKECSQERWETLLRTGLVKQDAVEAVANQVWPQVDEDEDLDGDDGDA